MKTKYKAGSEACPVYVKGHCRGKRDGSKKLGDSTKKKGLKALVSGSSPYWVVKAKKKSIGGPKRASVFRKKQKSGKTKKSWHKTAIKASKSGSAAEKKAKMAGIMAKYKAIAAKPMSKSVRAALMPKKKSAVTKKKKGHSKYYWGDK